MTGPLAEPFQYRNGSLQKILCSLLICIYFICLMSYIMYVYFNSFLVGEGAKQWAQQNGIPLIDSQEMKTGFIFLFSS